ncbi:uncharacterized protein LOC125646321 [Ostrea edulis]|uniref:uncharacterized protein LOC125646321 n=1 Tax=Ostrea edulis TaxID=37623 RepID=UPI0024AEA60D|nr:uncharacterized protein LOC125646321 [Ostrea edulis]
MPNLIHDQIENYFLYRMAEDKQMSSDIKAMEKGKDLLSGGRIFACSILSEDTHIYLAGIVGAAMKQKVSYNFKIGLDKVNGDPLNSHCECPAGKEPHDTCKHVAAGLLMIEDFIGKGMLAIRKGCTDNLQSFHVPKKMYEGKPLAAEKIPWKRKNTDEMLEDPRKEKYLKYTSGYSSSVYNCMVNYCSMSSMNIIMRYSTPSTSLQVASRDHDYLQLPFTEHLVDKVVAVHISESSTVPDHCREFALSDEPGPFGRKCEHKHDMVCINCEQIHELLSSISSLISESNLKEKEENRDDYEYKLAQAKCNISNWKTHIVRTNHQEKAKSDIMANMGPNEVILVLDWAMKYLPRRYREDQSNWFAKRGLSWHIGVAFRRRETIESLAFIHIFCGQISQDSNATRSVILDIVEEIIVSAKSIYGLTVQDATKVLKQSLLYSGVEP